MTDSISLNNLPGFLNLPFRKIHIMTLSANKRYIIQGVAVLNLG